MSMLSLDQALARLLAAARPIRDTEEVSTLDCHGRVLAAPLTSDVDVPPLDVSSMDGYALRAVDLGTQGARLPVVQRIAAGSVGQPLAPGSAARIFTGAPVPPGADAVVMQELCQVDADEVIVSHVPRPGEWITRAGADIRKGAEILAAGTRLTPQAAGLAAAVGAARLQVFRRLRVALFSTGSELVMPGQPLPPGAIYNSNRFMLLGLLRQLGCTVTDLGIVPDRLDATRAALREAARSHDLIVTSGGVSAGEEDHVKPAVEAEGALDLWKVALKPGKPLAFGRVGASEAAAAFIGLPGHPVSSFITFLIVVRPFVLRVQGTANCRPLVQRRRAAFDWPKPDVRREFLRARVNQEGELELFPNQSSAVLTSTVWADGLLDNPPGQPIACGDLVSFLPFCELLY